MNEFAKEIKALGPLGKSEGLDENELQAGLEKANKLIPYIKLIKKEKLALHDLTPANRESYKNLYTSEEIETLMLRAPSYWIDPEKCQACMSCATRCPVDAIVSAKQRVHVVDQRKCIKCGTCLTACPPKFSAVTKLVDKPVPPPTPEDKMQIVRKNKKNAA